MFYKKHFMIMNKKIQIILITYNIDITRCLDSIAKQSYQNFELLILDNGSHDATVKTINEYLDTNEQLKKKTKIVENKANLGFSKAVNIGLKKALGKNDIYTALLLNPDAYFTEDLFENAIKVFEEHPDAGAIESKILYPDNRIWWMGTRILSNWELLFSSKYSIVEHINKGKVFNGNQKEITEIDAITGCALFIKLSAVKKVGLLNERYFMYAEDVDYSMRLKKNGYKLYMFRDSTVFHEVKDNEMNLNVVQASRRKYTIYLKSMALYLLDYKPMYIFLFWFLKLPFALTFNYIKRAK
jgi:hypothetical protein